MPLTTTGDDESLAPEASAPPSGGARRIARGTDQQEALWAALAGGTAHQVNEARAGAGKSSSAREGMWRMLERNPSLKIRYAVYNKANAAEFAASCPPGVDVGTTHSFGYRALREAFNSRLEKNKTYLILDESREGRNLPRYLRKSVSMLVGHAKNAILRPEGGDLAVRLEELILHYDVNAYGRRGVLVDFARECLARSAVWTEVCDFDDMIWLAALNGVDCGECGSLFIDEVQDLNAAQHALAPLLAGGGRVIAIGDSFQAVNIFRGADTDSMPRLRAALAGEPCWAARALAEYPLTVTFRCPASHVALANKYVADLQALPDAPEGEIGRALFGEMVADCLPGDLVICPTNAPVVSACLKLIAQRRQAYVRGRALGDQLVTILRGLGDPATVREAALGVERWRGKELLRLADTDGIEDLVESVGDRADGLQAVLSACQSPGEAEGLIARLFSDDKREGVVTFSTIHRAKGDEASNVWLVEAPVRKPKKDWQVQQNRNLRYVGLTRSKHRLTFVEPPKRKGGVR